MIMCKTYTNEDFDEDCPRFIPMKYESEIYENGESLSWYIFDTEKLDFIGGIVPYYDYQEAENVCNIFNGVSYIFKGDVKLEGKENLLEIAEYVDKLQEENEQLKQQLKSIEDSFKFSCTENHFEFNKDEIKVEDTHTEITLKDGKLCISVFIPQLNEYVKFFYVVTGRKMEREPINYEGDVE